MTCPNCQKNLPEGTMFCNVCGETMADTAPPPVPIAPEPVASAPPTSRSDAKKKPAAAIAAALAVVLLLGGAVGGHFLGFYTLPLLPERGETGAAAPSHGTTSSGQRNLEPLHILSHAEIYLDSEDPMRGTVTLKGFDIPETLTLGLPGYEDWQTYAHIGVAFTCNDEVVYEVTVSEFANPHDDGQREVALSECQAQLWVHDPHAGHVTVYDKGRAWVETVSANSITMSFEFDPDAYVDMSKIKYIGYEYRLYDEIREEGVYDRSIESTGEWTVIENVNLSNYAGPDQEFYRYQQRRNEQAATVP